MTDLSQLHRKFIMSQSFKQIVTETVEHGLLLSREELRKLVPGRRRAVSRVLTAEILRVWINASGLEVELGVRYGTDPQTVQITSTVLGDAVYYRGQLGYVFAMCAVKVDHLLGTPPLWILSASIFTQEAPRALVVNADELVPDPTRTWIPLTKLCDMVTRTPI